MNLLELLYKLPKQLNDKTAVIEGENEISFSELRNRIDNLARGFKRFGIKEGEKVAIVLPNSIDFLVSFFALQKVNAVSVLLEHIYIANEYEQMLSDSDATVIITSPYIFSKILGFDKQIFKDRKIIFSEKESWVQEKNPGSTSIEELSVFKKSKLSDTVNIYDDETVTIFYTYRGLGYPVGIEHTHRTLFHGVRALIDVAPDARNFLAILPLSHVFGLLAGGITPLLRGECIVIKKGYSAKSIFQTINQWKINFMIGVPLLYMFMMRNYSKNELDISCLKYCISGGNYLSEDVYNMIEEKTGFKLLQGYGLTEAQIVSLNDITDNHPGTLGRVRPGVEIKIADENYEQVKSEEKGEVLVKGLTLMKGFYKKNELDKELILDGWLLTGDYGYFDKNGCLNYAGLKKRIAKIGGHSFDLMEIERIISEHPCVVSVTASVEEDLVWGQKIIANVFLGYPVEEAELRKYCESNMCILKVPRKFIFH
ncbi:class I adenylate-forming enzyme family protein [Elusimicrobiota bacterium]